MKRFPRAQVEVTYGFTAWHSVENSKHPQAKAPHSHVYEITIGFHHERNGPFTWDREELHEKFSFLIKKLDSSYLNDLVGDQATDEVLGSWALKQLPAWVDFVSIKRETPEELCLRALTTVRRRDLE
jgi:6-pyruvoyl-tetrahydropterin synthase